MTRDNKIDLHEDTDEDDTGNPVRSNPTPDNVVGFKKPKPPISRSKALGVLYSLREDLVHHGFIFALQGPWKEWFRSQPVRTIEDLNPVFFGCGDSYLDRIAETIAEVEELTDKVNRGFNGQPLSDAIAHLNWGLAFFALDCRCKWTRAQVVKAILDLVGLKKAYL